MTGELDQMETLRDGILSDLEKDIADGRRTIRMALSTAMRQGSNLSTMYPGKVIYDNLAELNPNDVELIETVCAIARDELAQKRGTAIDRAKMLHVKRLEVLIERLGSVMFPWVELTDEQRSSTPDELMVWATDGEKVEMACREVIPGEHVYWRNEDGMDLSFQPTHYTTIVRPEPPRKNQ